MQLLYETNLQMLYTLPQNNEIFCKYYAWKAFYENMQ